jgi:hypothetical protein
MYYVDLEDTATGLRKTITIDLPADEHTPYLWHEGNFSCDCNRYLLMYPDLTHTGGIHCGEDRFILHQITDAEGNPI